jgi:hypothetical protein
MYKVSKNSTKLKYKHIFKVLGVEKEQDMKADEKDIEDNYSMVDEEDEKVTEIEETKENGHDISKHDTDVAFVPQDDKQDGGVVPESIGETNEDHVGEGRVDDTQPNFDTDHKDDHNATGVDEGEENDDDYINDEEMIRIAEN